MKKSRLVYAILAVAISGMIVECKNNNGPIAPADIAPGNLILSEGFETDLSNYKQVTYYPSEGMMSLSTQHARSGKGSLTSDSNNTGIKKVLDPSINDSIAGLQFYVMAAKTAHANFMAAMGKAGSSANGLLTIIGMGIDKSDSLKYVYENAPNDIINEHKNFAALTLNKWYKCKIEYDYSDTTLTYYLDDAVVYTRTAPSPMTLQIFIVMRDDLGAQGLSGYYLDDVRVFKR
jgi:hypothetical protein